MKREKIIKENKVRREFRKKVLVRRKIYIEEREKKFKIVERGNTE
jgi:hypothetical protein